MKMTILEHSYQKAFFALLLFLSITSYTKAQSYAYFTYDDFLNQKYTHVEPEDFMFYKGYPDELIHISKKALWNNKDTWGYVWNQSLYRQANVRGAVSGTYIFKVIAVGEYVLYRYFNFSVGLPNGEIANANRIPIPIYYVSKNLNSPLYRADITHMDKVTAKDPIFSKLEKYLDKAPDSESFEFLVEEYIKNSKEYKPLKDLLPSAKK